MPPPRSADASSSAPLSPAAPNVPPAERTPLLAAVYRGEVIQDTWRVERILGHGGMGTVLLAQDLLLDRPVAVKLLADHLSEDPAALQRFEREARLTARLDHPNIVGVHAVGRHAGRPFIVMRYIEGERLSSSSLQAEAAGALLEAVRQICDGLAFIHRQGFVHRDVKPSNILIGSDGKVTILDFGVLREMTAAATITGTVIGTLQYMAPEQLLGLSHLDRRVDLYALGVTLLEALLGRHPFASAGPALMEQYRARQSPRLSLLDHSLPLPLFEMLLRAISFRPEDRFATAEEFLEAFERALQGKPALKAPRRPSRRSWVVGIAASCVLAMASASGWAFFKGARQGVSAIEPALLSGSLPPLARAPPPSPPPPPADVSLSAPVPSPVVGLRQQASRTRSRSPAPPVPGTLRVVARKNGQPTWASLTVDGVGTGTAPASLDLSPGRHRIRAEREGYDPVERVVTVRTRRSTYLVIDLDR